MKIETTTKEDKFIAAYFAAVDFTETGDIGQPETGTPLDDDFERESIIDCLAFYSRISCYISDELIEQAGHDFWLTRNGHGVGFWYRPEIYGERRANRFTELSESYGEAYAQYDEAPRGADDIYSETLY